MGPPLLTQRDPWPFSVVIQSKTKLSDAEYVREKGWLREEMTMCPLHPGRGCRARKHGSYGRVSPEGCRVARFYCARAKVTFSVLPDFLCSRFPGTMLALEAAVTVVENSLTRAEATEALRPAEAENAVTLTSAKRWVARRVLCVRAALCAAVTLLPKLFGCKPLVGAVRARVGLQSALVWIRQAGLKAQVAITTPVGFSPRASRRNAEQTAPPHDLGIGEIRGSP